MNFKSFINKQVSAVTIFTILIYGMVYAFQKGIACYYGYPDIFIKIDINTLLYSSSWLLFFSSLFFGGVFVSLFFDLREMYLSSFLVLCLVSVIPNILTIGFHIPIGFFIKDSIMNSWDVLVFSLVFISFYTGIWLPVGRKRVIENLESIQKDKKMASPKKISTYFDIKDILISLVLGVFTLTNLSFTFGKISSYKTNEYYVSNDAKKYVLINSLAGGFILGSCKDRISKFEFVNDLKNLEFQMISSGEDVRKLKECFERSVRTK